MAASNGSALDMRDLEATSGKARTSLSQRRRSSYAASHRRFSSQGSKPMNVPPSPTSQASSSKDVGTPPSSQSHGVTSRQRLQSLAHKSVDLATNFTSPLAQIYKPLVVDDDDGGGDQGTSSLQGGVSYGPASRRRLSSMHHFPLMESGMGSASHAMKRPGPTPLKSQPMYDAAVPESPAAEERATHEQLVPEQAADIVEDDGGRTGGMGLGKRLADMEERQKRMEALLIQLTQKLKSP